MRPERRDRDLFHMLIEEPVQDARACIHGHPLVLAHTHNVRERVLERAETSFGALRRRLLADVLFKRLPHFRVFVAGEVVVPFPQAPSAAGSIRSTRMFFGSAPGRAAPRST
jgi:hypothetical protein